MVLRLKARLLAGIFILMAMAVMNLHAQTPTSTPDMVNGGPFGNPSPGKPDQAVTNKANPEKVKDPNSPSLLECDEPYEVDVTLNQEVKSCDKVNYLRLRIEAKERADQEIANVMCPMTTCFVPSTWYGYWEWNCKQTESGAQAVVKVTEFKTCQQPNTKVSNGVGDGRQDTNNRPLTLGGPPPKEPVGNGEYITINSNTKWDGLRMDCGVSFLASYVYEVSTQAAMGLELQKNGTKLPDSATVKDFKGFYDQAVYRAQAYHDSFQCGTSGSGKCDLTPFKVVSGDIQVNGGANTVTITLYFWVECKK